ncbi:MAG TPA: 16S rRNA (uracil(1498)-N(3))-methyltransferase [Vicinamibacterales bacterium]|nr:16S rRNA (uracil(1498)-N(3))-methyltransferase [Vicinamibacterales bacterium]
MPRSRFYVPDAQIGDESIVLSADEAHHLTHVLRLNAGDEVGVFDGRGHEWRARVGTLRKKQVTLDLVESVPAVAEAPVRVTLGMALVKGDQMDAVIRDATALGVTTIAPLVSAHVTVPARAWKGDAARERWHRVAVAAAKQSGRAVVPEIAPVAPFEAAITGVNDAMPILMCVEPARAAKLTQTEETKRPASALLLVGPEGGWSEGEVALAASRGARMIALGPRTLRAELAPVVALSALWTRWDW